MAYLITCAGKKKFPILNHQSDINNLANSETFLESRLELIELTKIQLDWNKTLRAWELYSGVGSKLYPKVTLDNWSKPCVKIKILSTLFGWINHDDFIPYYNLKMDDKINDSIKVFKFWKSKNILENIIEIGDIDLLSESYKKAFNKNEYPPNIKPEIQWHDRYGHHKGKWLNQQLDSINC